MREKVTCLVSAVLVLLAPVLASATEMPALPLRDNVGIAELSGGEASNSRWGLEVGSDEFRNALRQSLDAAGLLERARGEGRYRVSAMLESGELPGVGLSLTVTTSVRYTLTDRESGTAVFQESLVVGFTTNPWDSMMNAKRLRAASLGAVRASTDRLAEVLGQMSLSQGNVSLAQ